MPASRYAQILTQDSIWQGNKASNCSQYTFHLDLHVERGGSPQLHVAVQVMPYLHYLQPEAVRGASARLELTPHVSLKGISMGSGALLTKPTDFGVFRTVLWPVWYLQPENG